MLLKRPAYTASHPPRRGSLTLRGGAGRKRARAGPPAAAGPTATTAARARARALSTGVLLFAVRGRDRAVGSASGG